jgi:hypothetical protein
LDRATVFFTFTSKIPSRVLPVLFRLPADRTVFEAATIAR